MLWSVALVFATIVVGGALDAKRRLPDLEPWHRIVPTDFRAANLTPQSTLADYLAIEDAAFRVVHDRVEQSLDPALRLSANRYNPDSLSYPGRFGTDWNQNAGADAWRGSDRRGAARPRPDRCALQHACDR